MTRAKLYHVPNWATGHVITLDCKWGCECNIPENDQTKPLKTKLAYLGKRKDR
ncbi:hypothetical protein ACNF40_07550 [Cuniculiplasma sp. SKW4]|uniref:hypothetical protein n=1 Tax=Cuniculiplasma sp. SKW4 TaxID=3400171 RepID=UPI003FCF1B92